MYVNLGWAYRNVGDYAAAVAATSKGYDLQPDDEKILLNLKGAYFDLGRSLFERERWNEAADILLEAVQLFPDEGWLYANLDWAYSNIGDYAAAVGYSRRGLQLLPADEQVRENLKGGYFALGHSFADS